MWLRPIKVEKMFNYLTKLNIKRPIIIPTGGQVHNNNYYKHNLTNLKELNLLEKCTVSIIYKQHFERKVIKHTQTSSSYLRTGD